jgi:hypothetical protein
MYAIIAMVHINTNKNYYFINYYKKPIMKLADYKKFRITIYVLKFLIVLSLLPFIADFFQGFIAGFKGDPLVISLPVKQINTVDPFTNTQPPFRISELEITDASNHADGFPLFYFISMLLGIFSLVWYINAIKNSFKALNSLSGKGIWMAHTTKHVGLTARGLLIAVVSNDLSNYLYHLYYKKTLSIPGFEILAKYEPSYTLLLTGVVIVLITWILKFGEQMKLEQDLTI